MNAVEQRQCYYRDADVRARIREFIGATTVHESSCEFLAASDENASPPFTPYPPRALNSLLDSGFEICRSLWDHYALIADFDIEYVNFDNPAEAFVDPERVFAIQQPVVETIEQLLREYGIEPLHVLSGRGHHFVWRIEQSSDEFEKLSALGRGPPSLWKCRNRTSSAEWPRCPNRVGARLRRSRPGDGIPCASGKTNRRAAHKNSGGADGCGSRAIQTWLAK